jgi:hypothetical protein
LNGNLRWNNGATATFGYCCAPAFQPGFDGPAAATSAASMWNSTGVIHYSIGGATTATKGLAGADGANTIVFNDPNNDLANFGSGVLAVGAVTNSGGAYSLGGQNFIATTEVEIVVAKSTVFPSGVSQSRFAAIVAHEMGHTLGFRHADGTGDATSPPPACAAPLPCSSGGQAIMEAFVNRTSLGPWDIDAAYTVYGTPVVCATTLGGVTSSANPVLPGQTFTLTANASTTTGTLSYAWFRGALGDTSNPIGSGQSVNVSQTATTTYWVSVSSTCGGGAQTGQVTVNLNTGTCGTNPNQLCVNNARYRVTLTAKDPTGKTGQGVALYQSNVFGYFSLPDFSTPSDPQVFVKVLGPVPGGPNGAAPWVFYAGLTNLDYTLTVIDTSTGQTFKTYHVAPPANASQSIGDFDVFGATSTQCANVNITSGQTGAGGACPNSGSALCLLGRFNVTMAAKDNPSRSNNQGPGSPVPVNTVFGFFTTPTLSGDPSDIQAFVKMIDATTFNGKFWVFLGGLTDFDFTMTVTDTTNGKQKIYNKPAGSTCGWNDTSAF